MTNFDNQLKNNDSYMTPKHAWTDIKQYIPNGTIWEPFYGDGKSGRHLADLGFSVEHRNEDFFKNNRGDIIVSNPPFSKIKDILVRLQELDKPFILIMPSSKINTQYFRSWKNKIKIIIPKKRINFICPSIKKSSCSFDCFYYCYKIQTLKSDITWLDSESSEL
tara:strand:- start:815 stop:1306 length:492 start_codon:yes stop_codon:yes gene_type:complete